MNVKKECNKGYPVKFFSLKCEVIEKEVKVCKIENCRIIDGSTELIFHFFTVLNGYMIIEFALIFKFR
jgi:hypothetical protein